ncbi:hypothetical protein BG003_007864 [Podila horticola]|nr:hypothetical protein BG003_007864 [Podila horticola]
MKDPPTRKTKKSHGTPSKGDSQPPHGELRPTFYNPFEVKHRQKITKSQYKILEKSFSNNHMPNGDTRQQLATQLSMTPRTIQVWFQNRRAKSKVSTAVTDHSTKSDTPSSSDMSNMEMGDSATEYLDRQEHDTPMFMQELFSQGSEPDLDDALDINWGHIVKFTQTRGSMASWCYIGPRRSYDSTHHSVDIVPIARSAGARSS